MKKGILNEHVCYSTTRRFRRITKPIERGKGNHHGTPQIFIAYIRLGMRQKGGQQLSTNSVPSPRLSSSISLSSTIVLLGLIGLVGAVVSVNIIIYSASLLEFEEMLRSLVFDLVFLYFIYIGITKWPYYKLIFGIGLLFVMILLGVVAFVSYNEESELYITWWIYLALWIIGASGYIFMLI